MLTWGGRNSAGVLKRSQSRLPLMAVVGCFFSGAAVKLQGTEMIVYENINKMIRVLFVLFQASLVFKLFIVLI